MQEYDVALKRILTRPGSAFLAALTGFSELRWLNVEMPRVTNPRIDLLGATPDGNLIHIECQSRNEKDFALRMADYLFAVRRVYGQLPRQIALYVGEPPLRMKNNVSSPDLTFRFHLVDIRTLDGNPLLASRNLSDNVIAVLTKLGSQPGIVRKVLGRIAEAPELDRGAALTELSILAGLRNLSGELKREAKKMPIVEDIMKNEIFGPAIRKGLAQGMAKGLAEGRAEGQRDILLELIEKRFGAVPSSVRKRVAGLKSAQLRTAALRLFDARGIDDIFVS